jgi:hypothetical protein
MRKLSISRWSLCRTKELGLPHVDGVKGKFVGTVRRRWLYGGHGEETILTFS